MRSVQDIEGNLQVWTEGFCHIHQRQVTKAELISVIKELKRAKERDYIISQFKNYNVVELDVALELIEKFKYSIEDDTVTEETPVQKQPVKSKKAKA